MDDVEIYVYYHFSGTPTEDDRIVSESAGAYSEPHLSRPFLMAKQCDRPDTASSSPPNCVIF